MKKLILILFLFVSFDNSIAQWIKQYEGYSDRWLKINETSFMLYPNQKSYSKDIYITTDKGKHWFTKLINVPRDNITLHFSNQKTAWAYSPNVLFKSEDGGTNWKIITDTLKFLGLSKIFFHMLNDSIGFIAGKINNLGQRKFLRTNNGGKSWQEIQGLNYSIQVEFKFISISVGMISTDLYSYFTTDGGNTWTQMNLVTTSSTPCVYLQSDSVWYVSDYYGTSKTTDAGNTWSRTTFPGKLTNIQFITERIGIATNDSILFRTTDGGGTWNSYPMPSTLRVPLWTDIFIPDTTNVFVSTLSSGIQKFSPDTHELSLLYPNNPDLSLRGLNQDVRWASKGLANTTLTIWYSINNGYSWAPAKTGVAVDSGWASINLIDAVYGTLMIKISSDNYPALSVVGSRFKFQVGSTRLLFSPNEFAIYLYSNGQSGYNSNGSGSSGTYWPHGATGTQTAIFEDGLIWGGKIGDSLCVGGSTYRSGLRAGRVRVNGTADDPDGLYASIFRVKKNWEELPAGDEKYLNKLSNDNWPGNIGAPYLDIDGNGRFTPKVDKPQQWGDDMAWFVANDLDTATARFLYGSPPIGVEMNCLTFGYSTGLMKDVLFKKYLLTNRSQNTVHDMYFGYWSDPDLGDANDDYVGCDSVRSLAYCYNGDNNDGGANGYGVAPPAIGYQLIQGPVIKTNPSDSAFFNNRWVKNQKNLNMTSFLLFVPEPFVGEPNIHVINGSDVMR